MDICKQLHLLTLQTPIKSAFEMLKGVKQNEMQLYIILQIGTDDRCLRHYIIYNIY